MAGWYELKKSSDGQFHFVLKAEDAETILTSELYTAKDSAMNGIASVQKNCAENSRYEKKDASNGKSFFKLKAANHQVISTSKMYASAALRGAGIGSMKTHGVSSSIRDNT